MTAGASDLGAKDRGGGASDRNPHCPCISESMIMRLFFVSFGFLRRVAFCVCHN